MVLISTTHLQFLDKDLPCALGEFVLGPIVEDLGEKNAVSECFPLPIRTQGP